jgi:Ras and Rab interactor 2/3
MFRSINDNVNDASQDNNEQSDSFYDEVDTTLPEKVMDMGKEKSDDEDLLLGNDNIESNVDSSSDEGVLAEGEDETSSSDESETQSGASPSPQCDISLMERLLRSHPVWFLPGLQRGGSVHLLQGKEVGAFIVRGSSQKNTMAISVRLPKDAGPYIEHYLIQSNEGLLNLESSRFKFDSIPALVAHYSNCCDELPVQLSLPRGIREAINRQQLMSLALLGSEFWRCPSALASPDVEETSIHSSQVKSPTDTSGIGTIELTGSLRQKNNSIFSAGKSNNQKSQQMVETPSDTASSLSSFAVSGAVGGGGHSQMLSPLSIDNVFVQSPTVEFCNLKSSNNSINNLNSPASGIIGKTSTFKASQIFSTSQKALPNIDFHHNEIATSASVSSSSSTTTTTTTTTHKRDENDEVNSQRAASTTRPTPPNTLNLAIASRYIYSSLILFIISLFIHSCGHKNCLHEQPQKK